MKKIILYVLFSLVAIATTNGQTALSKAQDFYKAGNYKEALPLFEAEYNLKKTNAPINHWYGASIIQTGGDLALAENLLKVGIKGRIRDSFLFLGKLYTSQFRLSEAIEMYDAYAKHLKQRGDDDARKHLEELQAELSRLYRMVHHTEDIQIIDSVVVDKNKLLSAYKMSVGTGKLNYYNTIFSNAEPIASTVYANEKETTLYYARPQDKAISTYSLYSMMKQIDGYKDEHKLSPNNFGLSGDVNYPFLMTDGVTIYFAAKDEKGIGNYDLYVSRYNMNNDTYLNPERLNMPFNSTANDYLMVIDETKGVGWFASDRFQPEGKVCVYTFIPNDLVRIIDSKDEKYLANRAQIKSIKETWKTDADYSNILAVARQGIEIIKKEKHDFVFIINDDLTYYSLKDFKNKKAQEAYQQVLSLRRELVALNAQLESSRDAYSQANNANKQKMKSNIQTMENRQEILLQTIPELEIKARNAEIYTRR